MAAPSGNVIVTGLPNFGTVELSPIGSNVWQVSASAPGQTYAEKVAVDGFGNAYVSGWGEYYGADGTYLFELTTIAYNPRGIKLWTGIDREFSGQGEDYEVIGMKIDSMGDLIVVFNYQIQEYPGYLAIKWATGNGEELWESAYPNDAGHSDLLDGACSGFICNNAGDLFITGWVPIPESYATVKLDTNGVCVRTNYYPAPGTASGSDPAITIDPANNLYVTGYRLASNATNYEIVTIKYDVNGDQTWLGRYLAPANGNAGPISVAVDTNGNVYVTGNEDTPQGGIEIVTIKYSPLLVQRHADGTVLLEAQGAPGQSFDVRASANLQIWQDLGSVTAGTNGIAQYDDTNAPFYDWRYYLTIPQ